jgi:hypothetical protein
MVFVSITATTLRSALMGRVLAFLILERTQTIGLR